jgi:hypothetical protein
MSFTRNRARRFLPVLGFVLCSLFSTHALAQPIANEPASQAGATPQSPVDGRLGLDSQFLRVEGAFWGTFGLKLSKNGQVVGPRFFSVVPDDVVAGSNEAKRHASHARIYHGVGLAFASAAIGLIVGGLVVRSNDREWTTRSVSLVIGGFESVVLEAVCGMLRTNEMMEAVNAYNYDLVRGKLGN